MGVYRVAGLFVLAGLANPLSSVPAALAEPLKLETMTVTATGIDSPRRSHPTAITKIDREEINLVRPDHITELVNRAPGLQVQRGNGQEHLTAIRSPVLTSGAGAGSFLYLEDGVPLRAAGFANVNGLFEAISETAGSIEIIRGPAGARYGSNAVHGLINVLSPAPGSQPETMMFGWAGPHGLRHLGAIGSTGWTGQESGHAVTGSLFFAEDDGFRPDSGFGQQKFQLRHDYRQGSLTVRSTLSGHNLNQETAGYVEGPNAYKDDALRKQNTNPEAYRDAWALRLASRWEYERANGDLIALTPYTRTNDMEFLMHFQPGTPVEENGHDSVGLLAAYHLRYPQGHEIIFGTDVEYTNGTLSEIQDAPTIGTLVQGVHYDYEVDATVIAPYIHTKWQLGEKTTLTAGLRGEYTDYQYDNKTSDGITGRFLRPADRSDDFFDLTPKLGLTHTLTPSVTLFGNIARAARAPQTTDMYRLQSKQVIGQIDSEKLDSIEIGARGQWSQIDYEIAAFAMRKENFYFRDADGLNVSDGKTRHVGVEAEIFAPLPANFDIAISATYARHTYDFNNIVSSLSNSTESIRSGDDVDTAPRTLANVRLGYNFLNDTARAELEWVHVGDYFMDASNTVEYPGHDLFNLRLNAAVTENLSAYVRVTNLADTRYAERADYFFGNERYFPGEDRALHVGGAIRF